MSSYSDEPVLVKPSARRDWRKWAAAVAALAITGLIVYVPFEEKRLEEAAHHAPRGERKGVKLDLQLDGAPHTLELTWYQGRFAPVLAPAPPDGAVLNLSGRFGRESLTWNAELGAFGPGKIDIDPYRHYKLSLSLEQGDRVLWRDTAWAYGVHDSHHGHDH